MTITIDSQIIGMGGTVAEALEYSPSDQIEVDYTNELFRLCELVGFDARILFAQAVHETDDFSSSWWIKRRNPAGIGITGDPDQDYASHTWKNGTEAARAHVAHMIAYVFGSKPVPPSPALVEALPDYARVDPRYLAVFDAGFAGTVHALGDLGNGRWATDPNYAALIAAKANQIFKEEPMVNNMTKGLIPLPTIINKLIPDAQNSAWDNLGQRTVKGFVLHRMLGSLDGTDVYFRGMANAQQTRSGGLTDYGQNATTGTVYQWNDPLGLPHPGVSPNRAGWASGVFNVNGDAYGDGLAFEQKYGLNAINRDQVSWEVDGTYGDPWSDAAMQIAAQACAHYAHDYGIPWDQFPIAPQDGFSFVRWHQEITGPAEKICPGPVVMQQTDVFIQKTKAIMQMAQTGTAPQPMPTVPWNRGDVGVQEIKGAKALAMVGEITARRNVPLRDGASSKSKVLTSMKAHDTAVIVGTIRQPGGRWAFVQIDESGATYRAPLSAFSPQFPTL